MSIRNEFRAGLFVAICLGLFMLSVFALGRERQVFARQEPFVVVFDNVKGLTAGAAVRLAGITIGRVSEVAFSPDARDTRVHATLLIDERYLGRMTSNLTAGLETQGLLGDRYVALVPDQTAPAEVLKSGAAVRAGTGGDIADLAGKASSVVDNVLQVSEELKRAVRGGEGGGQLAVLIRDLSEIVARVKDGKGIIHRLVFSEQEGDEIMKALGGAAGDVSSLTRDLRALTDEIRRGDGVLHQLFFSTEGDDVRELLTKLAAAVANIESASRSLAQGSGTLGALLLDSSIYDNLVEVTDEAKRSFLLRQAIRSSLE